MGVIPPGRPPDERAASDRLRACDRDARARACPTSAGRRDGRTQALPFLSDTTRRRAAGCRRHNTPAITTRRKVMKQWRAVLLLASLGWLALGMGGTAAAQ